MSGHHSADVEAKNDVLAVLALEDGGDRLGAACSGLPVYVPIIVVNGVVAEVAKLPAGAGQSLGPVATGSHQSGPHQRLIAAHFQKVRIDLDGFLGRDSPVDPGQAHRAAAAQRNVAKLKVTALRGNNLIIEAHRAMRWYHGERGQ